MLQVAADGNVVGKIMDVSVVTAGPNSSCYVIW